MPQDDSAGKMKGPPAPPPPPPPARTDTVLQAQLPQGLSNYSIPVSSGDAMLSIPRPISRADVENLRTWLQLFTDRLIASPERPQAPRAAVEAGQPLAPGDLAQWESQGQNMFPEPKRIRAIQDGFAIF